MGLIEAVLNKSKKQQIQKSTGKTFSQIIKFSQVQTHKERKKSLLEYLEKLQQTEARLWGVTIKTVSNSEDRVLEDTNHLIYLINNDKSKLKKILNSKDVKTFRRDLKNLREDFLFLKRQIKRKDALKNLISNYTIKLVNEENYPKLENIFLLEKQLHEVIDKQNIELSEILKEVSSIKIPENSKVDIFISSLLLLRKILSGHMDHHSLWEEEMQGYSNTSNIIHAIIKEVNSDI